MRIEKPYTNVAINAVRSIAALIVVIGHIRTLFFADFSEAHDRGYLAQALYLLGSLGHPAVIVFFVLSGYWVGGSVIRGLKRRTFSVRSYAVNRLTRLWIVLVPAVILTQILDRVGTALLPGSSIYAGTSDYHKAVPIDGAINHLDAITTLGNLFFVQSIHVRTIGNDTPLWSLSFEFWYYAMFPALLILIMRVVPRRIRFAAALVLVAAAAISGLTVLVLFATWILGAAIAWQQERIGAAWNALQSRLRLAARVVLPLLLLLVASATIALNLPTTVGDYCVALVAGLLIASLITDVSARASRNGLAVFSWSAEWSYSLYATHLPVIALLAAVFVPQASGRWQLSASSVGLAAGVLAVALAVGFAFYQFSERHTGRVRALFDRPKAQASVAPVPDKR